MSRWPSCGAKGWLGLVLYIVGVDLYAFYTKKDTLSMAFFESIRHPVKRWPVILAWFGITFHLFHWIPDRYDPLRSFSENRSRIRKALTS